MPDERSRFLVFVWREERGKGEATGENNNNCRFLLERLRRLRKGLRVEAAIPGPTNSPTYNYRGNLVALL